MWKFLKMLIGIALIPQAWAVSISVYELYQTSTGAIPSPGWETWSLPIGFILWAGLFFLLPRPARTYVLGHELTHVLWAVAMGGRIGKIKVGKSGGHVELSKSNFLIALAPYFFPFYTALVIATYFLAGVWTDVETHQAWWLAAIGLTWSFHITFTIHTLSKKQPDIHEHGLFFSYTTIYIMNVLAIGIWMVLVGTPRFSDFGELLVHKTTETYKLAWVQLEKVWMFLSQCASNQV